MKTPREKYQNDPAYSQMVNLMVSYLHQCQFTPSEMREMAVLASTIHEEHMGKSIIISNDLLKKEVISDDESNEN